MITRDAEELELLAEFLDESMDALDGLDSLFVELEHNPTPDNISAIFRPVHSMKGNASYFGMEKLTLLAHELETLLDLCRKGKISVDACLTTTLLAAIDELKAMLNRMRLGDGEIADAALYLGTRFTNSLPPFDHQSEAFRTELNRRRRILGGRKSTKHAEAGHRGIIDKVPGSSG